MEAAVPQTGVWEIGGDETPYRLKNDHDYLEHHLETWIEHDPTLLGTGIRWIARQLVLPDRSRLDLLGLSVDGTWVVAELKRSAVDSATVAQAVHYFLELSRMTNEELVHRVSASGQLDPGVHQELIELADVAGDTSERDYLIIVSGVGTGENAETAGRTLADSGFSVPVRVVTFNLVATASGSRLLLRDIDDVVEPPPSEPGTRWSLEAVLERAEAVGVGPEFRLIRDELERLGYRASLKQSGLNFNKGTRQQVFWVKPLDGQISIGFLAGNFPVLFGVDEATANQQLGENWLTLSPNEAVAQMHRWMTEIEDWIKTSDDDATESGYDEDRPNDQGGDAV